MKKILILLSLLWLAACTTPNDVDENASPTPIVETETAVPPTPTIANPPTETAVPTETSAAVDTAVPPTATSTAEPPPTRIQFDPGDTSVTITDSLDAFESTEYLAWAATDQYMQIEIISNDNAANFSVTGTSDGQPYKRLVNEDRLWSIILPQSQDYLIRVTALEATDFTLTLSITSADEAVLQPVWPIVDGASGYLLGGSHNGQWLDALTVMPSLQDGQQTYQLYTESQLLGQIEGTIPFVTEFGPCAELPTIGFPAASDLTGSIGLVAGWNAVPRVTEPLPLDTPVYVQAVADYLQANGISDPEVVITRIDKIDFEGDGVYEILISASRLTGLGNGLPTAAAGDYSLVLMRKVVDGTVITFPVVELFFPEAVELAAPAQFSLIAFLDLNGNGTLEIVMENLYYEGRFVSVHEITNQGATRVLTAGCRL